MAVEQNNVDQGRRGDLNQDGVVNISDAVLLINHYLNGTTNQLTIGVADVNNDGEINISDPVHAACYWGPTRTAILMPLYKNENFDKGDGIYLTTN